MKLFFVIMAVVMATASATRAQTNASPATLRRAADDYYNWRNRNYPVSSSDAGLHTWDHKLTNYSPAAIEARRQHARSLLAEVNAMPAAKWKPASGRSCACSASIARKPAKTSAWANFTTT